MAEKISGGRKTQNITFSSDAQLSSRNSAVRVSNLPSNKHSTAGATAFKVMVKDCMVCNYSRRA